MIVAVDPGVKAAGVAAFDDGDLVFAFLAQGERWESTARAAFDALEARVPFDVVTEVVIEVPQVYTQNKLKGDPNDLIRVAMMAGAFVAQFPLDIEVTEYLPSEWKGQVRKRVMTRRIKSKMTSEEHDRVDWPKVSLRHNVYDAVGIGFYRVRRLR